MSSRNEMSLILVGINHKTADISLREKVAFPPEIVSDALRDIRSLTDISEVVLLSTCNRTELYIKRIEDEILSDKLGHNTKNSLVQKTVKDVVSWLASFNNFEFSELERSVYSFSGMDVVRHLMKVSCGLDSLVLGEPQILGQTKSAFALAKDLKTVGPSLNRAFIAAFSIAKKVRTDTAIGENPVSVAYAATVLAERIFSDFQSLSILLIGAGRTIELVATHFNEKNVSRLTVANRTLDNALEIALKFGGKGVLLSEIPEQLETADVVVSSTNSQLPLLGKGSVERALQRRKHQPMLLIDLAVPRDIEAQVGEIADAYLYSIDDISGAIEDSIKSRTEAAIQAEAIIDLGVEEYERQLRSLDAVSTLKAFREKADRIREEELERAIKSLSNGEPVEQVLESLARTITNKFTHAPSVQLKTASSEGRTELIDLVNELFELKDVNN